MSDLKKCPMCGELASIEHDERCFRVMPIDGWKVSCQNCALQTCWWHGMDKAIAAWNHRPVEDALRDALEECLEYFEDRQDADHNGVSFVANKEMRMAMEIKEVLDKAGAK